MNCCRWCGKPIYGFPVRDYYCSQKCWEESREVKRSKRESRTESNSPYEVEHERSTGLFGIIWKVVKWVIIITIVWFVYDNYLK